MRASRPVGLTSPTPTMPHLFAWYGITPTPDAGMTAAGCRSSACANPRPLSKTATQIAKLIARIPTSILDNVSPKLSRCRDVSASVQRLCIPRRRIQMQRRDANRRGVCNPSKRQRCTTVVDAASVELSADGRRDHLSGTYRSPVVDGLLLTLGPNRFSATFSLKTL